MSEQFAVNDYVTINVNFNRNTGKCDVVARDSRTTTTLNKSLDLFIYNDLVDFFRKNTYQWAMNEANQTFG